MTWMLYGANGFTGRLIVEEAVRRGLRPIVAGRNAVAIEAIANQHGLERTAGFCSVGASCKRLTVSPAALLNQV